MPIISGTNEPSNNIGEINDSNVEESNAEDSNVEESNAEDSIVEESNAEDYIVEESNAEDYIVEELDIYEPIEENSDTNQSSIKDMTIKELKNVLTDMELPTSGNKTKLLQRIISNQK
jgi:hypothetical protein